MGRSGRLFLLLRPYALLFVANLVATFVASVMDGATFVLLIPFLRTLFGHDPLNVAGGSAVERLLAVVVGPLFADGSPGAALRNVVLVLVAAMVIKNVLAYLASVSSVAIQGNVVRDLRVRLFGHLQTLPLDFFQRTRAGQLLSRVINDTDAVKTVVTGAVASLVQNVSLIVVYVAILVALSWQLTLVALVCAPLLVLIVRPMVGRVRWRSREQADQRGELTSLVSELVGSIKLVRAYVAERFEADRFRRLADRYRKGVLRAQRYALLTSPVSEVFAGAVIVLIFAVGTRLALGQAAVLRPEVFIAFIAVALRLMSPVKSVANYPTAMATALAAADRVFEVLDLAAEEGDRPGEVPARFERCIEHRGVTLSYNGQPPLTQGVDLAVRRAPVARDRGRPVARPADPDPGRSHERTRHGVRAPGAGGDRPADGAPHDLRHRPSARHRAARRRDRRARRRADRRAGDARYPVRGGRAVSAAARHAIPTLTCSRALPSSGTRSGSTTRSCPRSARFSTPATRWR